MGFKAIAPAVALKAFRGRGINVQEAKPLKVKDSEGKEREAFETSKAPLAEKHILSAKLYDDGKLTITTIDGQKHEAQDDAPKSEAPAK